MPTPVRGMGGASAWVGLGLPGVPRRALGLAWTWVAAEAAVDLAYTLARMAAEAAYPDGRLPRVPRRVFSWPDYDHKNWDLIITLLHSSVDHPARIY